MSTRASSFRLPYSLLFAVVPYLILATWLRFLAIFTNSTALTVAAGVVLAAAVVRSLRIRIEIDEHELVEFRLLRTVHVPRTSIEEVVLADHFTRRCYLPALLLADGTVVPLKSLMNVMRPEHYLDLIDRIALAAGVRADLEPRRVFRLSGLTRRS